MYFCEICGDQGERHHIVWRSQGGFDFPINYKYLCPKHHRGKKGPHNDDYVDLLYKIEMQEKLQKALPKDYYKIDELVKILDISKRQLNNVVRHLKFYKEGYNTKDVILQLMGGKNYSIETLEDYMLEVCYKNIEI